MEVRHGRLVLGTVPSHVPWLSMSVSVHVLVVLMVDWSLASSPLSVRVGHGRVLWEDAGNRPVEQVWVVDKSLVVEGVIVHHNWAVITETTSNTPKDEEADPTVSQPASNVEVLDGKLADHGEAEKDADLGPGRVARPVEVGLVSRSSDLGKIILWEPACEDSKVVLGLRCPFELSFFKAVLRDTEADQLAILDVIRNLCIHTSSKTIIVCVLIVKDRDDVRKIVD